MKKVSILFYLLVFTINSYAQSILQDRTEGSVHIIQTSFEPRYLHKGFVVDDKFSAIKEIFADSVYSVRIIMRFCVGDKPISYPNSLKLHLKLDNGEILSLPMYNSIEIFQNTYETVSGRNSYYVYPEYVLSEEALMKIKMYEIVKLRIEIPLGKGYYDVPNESEMKDRRYEFIFDKKLKKMITLLDEASTPKNILENF